MAGEIFYVAGTLIALVMWGFGLIWLWFAIATLSQGPFPFNLGWWSFTFPLGQFQQPRQCGAFSNPLGLN
jgi:tellurite resistance protein TehA-like permease